MYRAPTPPPGHWRLCPRTLLLSTEGELDTPAVGEGEEENAPVGGDHGVEPTAVALGEEEKVDLVFKVNLIL